MKDWFIDIADCCGCSACAQACAHSCISMQPNAEGFLVPVVDRTNCVDCGLCEMACPVKNRKKREEITPDVYIGRTTDEELLSSCSSGGLASILSKAMVEQGGVVFGVRFDEQWNAVYDYAETIEQLISFKGSKYVDAVVGDAYKQVKEFLKKGRQVLYIGTPCHVSGLNQYLRKDYENLVTVDIMCHAVPSPMVWQKYLQSLTKERITGVSFRSKAFGWENYGLKIDTKERTIVHEPNDNNVYMQGFMHGLTVRTSCANCLARGFASGSDIMIGDYWELSKHYPELYDEQGMSVAFVFSEKGKALLENLQQHIFLKPIPWDAGDYKEMHATLFKSIRLHQKRQAFFEHVPKSQDIRTLISESLFVPKRNALKQIIKSWLRRRKKIAIVSPFSGVNYGTLLQAYSLAHVIRDLGYECEYITYTPNYKRTIWERIASKIKSVCGNTAVKQQDSKENYSYLNSLAYVPLRCALNEFIQRNIPYTRERYNPRTIKRCVGYSKYLVGSDQTWSLENYDKHAFYYLNWVRCGNKYAYAPSLGTTNPSDLHKSILSKYLKNFRYISCREKANCETIARQIHKPVEHVVDPTALLPATYWRNFEVSVKSLPDKYILAYILGEKECITDFAERLSAQLNIPVYYVLTNPIYLNRTNLLRNLSPEQWVYAIDHAQCVVTDSFHGSLFSINMNTDFYVFTKRQEDVSEVLNDNDRIMELLTMFGLESRFVNDREVPNITFEEVDYTEANEMMEQHRKQSLMFVNKILKD